MRKGYTAAQKAEALALAEVLGSEGASDQLGIDVRTVRGWRAAAGYRPDLDPPKDQLEALYDLALSKVTEQVASGKIKGTQLMTVLGVARDKLDRARREQPAPAANAIVEQAVGEVLAHIEQTCPDPHRAAQALFRTTVEAQRIRGSWHEPGPHDPMTLAWVVLRARLHRPDLEHPELKGEDMTEQEAAQWLAWAKAFVDAGDCSAADPPPPVVYPVTSPPDYSDLLARADAALAEP